jgi:hypothetical protein
VKINNSQNTKTKIFETIKIDTGSFLVQIELYSKIMVSSDYGARCKIKNVLSSPNADY